MFKLLRIPYKITDLLYDLHDLFTSPQWNHFQSMVVSLLITPLKPTVTGRSTVLGFGPHRTKRNDFLSKYSHTLSQALRYYALILLYTIYQDGEPLYIIFDDSKASKRGKKMQATYRFFDHIRKQYGLGHHFVCCTLLYRGFIIPYAIELYRNQEYCTNKKFPFHKLTHIVEHMIGSMPDFGISRVYVIADTYYSSKDIVKACRNKHYHFVSFLKSNRRIRTNGHSTNVSTFVENTFHRLKKRHRKIHINGNSYRTLRRSCEIRGMGTVSVVFSQKQGRKGVLALFTTDESLSTRDILAIYSYRWSIEVLFKYAKQYTGLVAYQHRNEEAVRSHLQLSLIAYALLTHLFIDEQRAKGKHLTKKLISQFSFRESLGRLRAMVFADTIDCIEQLSHSHKKQTPEHIFKELKSHIIAA